MSATTSPTKPARDPETDISSQDFWAKDFEERDKAFAKLRSDEPVSYHRPYESTLLPPDENTPGFWSLVKYQDIRKVSRDRKFISGEGMLMEDFPEQALEKTASFLAMDDPEHRALRGIVSHAFTPRNVRKIDDWVHEHSKELVDEMIEKGEGDFCELFAKELPGRIFAHFFGLPKGSDRRADLMDAAEKMLAWDDPKAANGRTAAETFMEEATRIQEIALEVAHEKRDDPGDDLVSWVVQAEFEGRSMEDWEIGSFFSLLGSAANDTTRHSTAHAIRLFSENPDQLDYLKEDLDGRVEAAVEEVIRYSSPVQHFRRTATEDTEIRGQEIGEGEKVVLWYCAGNRDEEQFEEAGRFNISRENNKHLGFGGGGPHFCMGSELGRQMLKGALTEIYTRMPDIEVTGDPVFQVNNFIHGVQELPVRWTPSSS